MLRRSGPGYDFAEIQAVYQGRDYGCFRVEGQDRVDDVRQRIAQRTGKCPKTLRLFVDGTSIVDLRLRPKSTLGVGRVNKFR